MSDRTGVPDGFEPFSAAADSPFLDLRGPLWIDRTTRPAGLGVLVEDKHTPRRVLAECDLVVDGEVIAHGSGVYVQPR
ncbi:MAG TPA: hypothetical protein VL595_30985 [Pseudonocardia sp.]|jgi:hypothetical protein|nr:hypothetical protein [Pseudonocardia sp.]